MDRDVVIRKLDEPGTYPTRIRKFVPTEFKDFGGHISCPDTGLLGYLVAAEQFAAGADPCAALAAHEQEVGAACRAIPTSRTGGDDLYHQLAGALVGIVGIAVTPDVGTSLRPRLDDVLAKTATGEEEGIPPAKHILPSICVHFRRAPLPIGELGTGAVCITCAQKFDSRETPRRYVGITRRQNDLTHTGRGQPRHPSCVHERRTQAI